MLFVQQYLTVDPLLCITPCIIDIVILGLVYDNITFPYLWMVHSNQLKLCNTKWVMYTCITWVMYEYHYFPSCSLERSRDHQKKRKHKRHKHKAEKKTHKHKHKKHKKHERWNITVCYEDITYWMLNLFLGSSTKVFPVVINGLKFLARNLNPCNAQYLILCSTLGT